MGTTQEQGSVSYEDAMKQLHRLFLDKMDPATGLVQDPTGLRQSKGYSDRDYYYPLRSLNERQLRVIDGRQYVIYDLRGRRLKFKGDTPAATAPDYVGKRTK